MASGFNRTSRRAIVPQCYSSHVMITSRQNPLVARYRDAARGRGDAILLDGAHLVDDAIRAGVAVRDVAVTPAAQLEPAVARIVAALSRSGVPIAQVSEKVMDALSPVRSASGIVALTARPERRLDDLYAGAAAPLVIAAVDVQDPGNLGAIARVAEAGGATGMIAAGASADPFSWKALRGSMGSSLRLPIATLEVDAAMADARGRGCTVVASAPRGGRSLYEVDLRRPTLVLVGGEGAGLAAALVDSADERITIPMQAPVESLNAAAAAALLVYEARRQRAEFRHEVTKSRRSS